MVSLDSSTDSRDAKEPASFSVTLKILIPPYVAGSIIGKGGEQIKDLKSKTKAHIKVSGRDELFPYTDERIVLLVAPAEGAMEAITFIHSKLRSRSPPANGRFYGDSDNKKRLNEMKIIIADTSAGKIIGKRGETVKKIQESHNVKVFLTSKDDWGVVPGERIATISGEETDVNNAIEDILAKIQEDPYARLNKSLAYPPYPMYDYHGYMGPPDHYFRDRRRESPESVRKDRNYDYSPRNNGYQAEPTRYYHGPRGGHRY